MKLNKITIILCVVVCVLLSAILAQASSSPIWPAPSPCSTIWQFDYWLGCIPMGHWVTVCG